MDSPGGTGMVLDGDRIETLTAGDWKIGISAEERKMVQ